MLELAKQMVIYDTLIVDQRNKQNESATVLYTRHPTRSRFLVRLSLSVPELGIIACSVNQTVFYLIFISMLFLYNYYANQPKNSRF